MADDPSQAEETEQDDRGYYLARAAAERELERLAKDQGIAGIHRQLALRYERLAAGVEKPSLQVIRE